MTRAPHRVYAILAAAFVAIAGIGVAATTTAATQAAWTDTVRVSAVATAGTWSTPTVNSCTAKDQDGATVACAITGITYTYDSYNKIARFYVAFSAKNAKHISYTADLSAAVPQSGSAALPSSFWAKAGLVESQHATPSSTWTCSALPTFSATTAAWQTQSNYLVVTGDRTSTSTICP